MSNDGSGGTATGAAGNGGSGNGGGIDGASGSRDGSRSGQWWGSRRQWGLGELQFGRRWWQLRWWFEKCALTALGAWGMTA
jgi:hypothetical protein